MQSGRVCSKKGGTWGILTKKKRKKTLCLDQDFFFWGEWKEGKCFYNANCLFSLFEDRGQMERAHVIDGLIGVDQKFQTG